MKIKFPIFKISCLILICTSHLFSEDQHIENDVQKLINLTYHSLADSSIDSAKLLFHKLKNKYSIQKSQNENFHNCLNLGIIYNCGRALFISGSVKEAIFYLRRSIEISESVPESYNQLGILYFNIGKIKDSIEYYKRALKYDYKNEYQHCYEYIFTNYVLMKNPHMALHYSKFVKKEILNNHPVLKDIYKKTADMISSDYPIEIKQDTNKNIIYHNKKASFTVEYPFYWTETIDLPFDPKTNQSILILSMEEIKDKNNEYTLSSIAIQTNHKEEKLSVFINETLKRYSKGNITEVKNKFWDNSTEYLVKEEKYFTNLIFVKGDKLNYLIIFDTTDAAYDLDKGKFKYFLKNIKLYG